LGQTALWQACKTGSFETVKLLLDCDAKVTASDIEAASRAALYSAEMMKALVNTTNFYKVVTSSTVHHIINTAQYETLVYLHSLGLRLSVEERALWCYKNPFVAIVDSPMTLLCSLWEEDKILSILTMSMEKLHRFYLRDLQYNARYLEGDNEFAAWLDVVKLILDQRFPEDKYADKFVLQLPVLAELAADECVFFENNHAKQWHYCRLLHEFDECYELILSPLAETPKMTAANLQDTIENVECDSDSASASERPVKMRKLQYQDVAVMMSTLLEMPMQIELQLPGCSQIYSTRFHASLTFRELCECITVRSVHSQRLQRFVLKSLPDEILCSKYTSGYVRDHFLQAQGNVFRFRVEKTDMSDVDLCQIEASKDLDTVEVDSIEATEEEEETCDEYEFEYETDLE
jgi:hypothetical protein